VTELDAGDDPRRDGGPVDVVLAFLAALGRADVAAATALVADDFRNEHTAALGTGLVGRDAYRERLPGFLATFRGISYEPEDVVAEGDRVVVPYRMTARYVDERGEHPVVVRGVFRFRVVDGLIAHRVDYWDSKVFLDQLPS
jgi:ketosteroid isomerase-like protein